MIPNFSILFKLNLNDMLSNIRCHIISWLKYMQENGRIYIFLQLEYTFLYLEYKIYQKYKNIYDHFAKYFKKKGHTLKYFTKKDNHLNFPIFIWNFPTILEIYNSVYKPCINKISKYF